MIFNTFEDFFALNYKAFGWVGLRFDLAERSARQNRFSKLLGLTCVLTSMCMTLGLFLNVIDTSTDVLLKYRQFPTLLLNIVCLSRVLCIYSNYGIFVRILKDLKEYYDIQKKNTVEDANGLIKNAKIVIFCNKFQLSIYPLYIILPIIGSIIIYAKTTVWSPRYPLDVWYPYDKKDFKFYIQTYAIEMLFGFIYTVYCGLDTLIAMIITHINHQFLVLSNELSRLKDFQYIKPLVERHCRLIE